MKIPGKKVVEYRSKEEWIIVPEAHEAIISESDFQKALASLKRAKYQDAPAGHIFYDKVKCPVCGHT